MKRTLLCIILIIVFSQAFLSAQICIGVLAGLPELVALRVTAARDYTFGCQLTLSYVIAGLFVRGDVRYNKLRMGNCLMYGFIGTEGLLTFQNMDWQALLDFGVGVEWGTDWIFGIEGALAVQYYPLQEENDTMGFLIDINLTKRL